MEFLPKLVDVYFSSESSPLILDQLTFVVGFFELGGLVVIVLLGVIFGKKFAHQNQKFNQPAGGL